MALACIQAYAYNVTGRVVDDKDKQPLPGVSIKVCLGTQDSAFLYTATNQEGRFVVTKGTVLLVSDCLTILYHN